jgi:hypothetical protein
LKKLFFFFAGFLLCHLAFAQIRFSIATDASLLRNLSPQQKFWSFGQGVEADFHFSKKNTAYAWINYHTQGSFTNRFVATAKSPATTPPDILYTVKGKWSFRQVSLGWKHFFKGSFNEEQYLNFYGAAGFGLLFSKVANETSPMPDTSIYQLAQTPVIGSDEFKRLTFDLAAGAEYPLASGIFLYGDIKTSLPASGYPSPFFHNREKVPFPLSFNAGLRILFGYEE